jgi:hypothetical protein
MTGSINKDADIQALLREYERVCTDVRAIETMNDKVVGFGLTIGGAAFAYGIQQHLGEVFFVVPVALIGVFFYATLQYHNMFWFGGYKRAVEERINALSGTTVLGWEALVETRRRRVNVINASLVFIYLALLVTATTYSLYQIFSTQPPLFAQLYAAFILVLMLFLLASVRQMFGAFKRSYDASRVIFGVSTNRPPAQSAPEAP